MILMTDIQEIKNGKPWSQTVKSIETSQVIRIHDDVTGGLT